MTDFLTCDILLKCLPVWDKWTTHTMCFCHRNWQSFQFHHADFSFFHPALIQQDNRPLQSCLAEHFTFTACCYLLILATLLLSIAFHLSFIFFNHAHATTFFSLYFLSPALSRKQFTCQAEGSMQLPGLRCDGVRACACVCMRDRYLGRNAFNHTLGARSLTGSSKSYIKIESKHFCLTIWWHQSAIPRAFTYLYSLSLKRCKVIPTRILSGGWSICKSKLCQEQRYEKRHSFLCKAFFLMLFSFSGNSP